jgi:predicted phage terminase large subunit-like protein
VAGAEAADSLVQREALWNWYLNEARTRLKPGAFVALILTRWHLDDIAGRILPKNWSGESGIVETEHGEKWEVICLPAIAGENDAIGRAPGEALWPEYITLEMLENERKLRGPRSWSALYQQTPIPEKGGEFKREWMKFYKRADMTQDKTSRMTRVIVADPAHSRKVDSDRTAMFTVGLAEDGNYYILDIVADRLSLTQKGDALFSMHRNYKPVRTGWERYGMQSDIEHFEDRMARDGYRFHITELKGPQRKEDRIRRLVPIFENRRLYFPEELYKTLSDGSYQDMVQLFISEMTRFPSGRHDDMLDGLSRMLDPEMNFRYDTAVQPTHYRQITQRAPDADGLWF